MAYYDLSVLDCYCFAVEFVLPEHAVEDFLAFLAFCPQDVVAVETGVEHLSVGAE